MLAEFDQAIKGITERRGNVYAHPRVNFTRIADLTEVINECPNPLVRHAMAMICVKLSRLVETPDHLDSWVDIVGYARTAVMCLEPPVHQDEDDGA
jgi:hypothetical protein